MATRPILPVSAKNAGFLARAFTEQRGTLVRYTARLLDGDIARAEGVVQAASEDESTKPSESAAQAAEESFAACRRRAITMARQEERTRRFAERPVGSVSPGTEDHVTLLGHLERLTPKQQEAVRLKFQNGFGYAAIARITELPVDKVALLTHTAIARLRSEYPSQIPVDDSHLTACALDEQSDEERAALEPALRDDPALRAKVAEIRAFATQIEEALAIEAGARAPRRAPVAGTGKKFKLLRFPALWFVLGGAALAGVVTFFFLRPTKPVASGSVSFAGDFRLKPASWQEGTAENPTTPVGSNHVPDVGKGDLSEKPFRDLPAPPIRTSTSKPATATSAVPRDLENTGEAVEKNDYGPTKSAAPAAMGGTRAPSGAVDRGGGKTPAKENVPVEKLREKPAPEKSEPSSDQPAENSPPSANARGERPKPARLAKRSGGAPGGSDFQSPSENAVSALPSDTDMASVPALFRAVGAGDQPAASAVRVEELLNYFPTADAPPKAVDAFSANLECTEAPWNSAHRLVRIGLKGRNAPPSPRGGANLVFLLDVSGSMDLPNRLPLVKEAMRLLLGRLQPDDRVAIVTYAGESQLSLPSTPVSESPRIRHVLDALRPAGQTNGGAGIQLAYVIAKASFVEGGINRVILCTDGDFNLGLLNADALSALAAEQAKDGIFLSVFGFGRGHQIDARLESLAANGQGRSGYVNTRREAERALAEEIDGLFAPIARDVHLQVAFNPAFVAGYRLIGYENDELPSGDSAPRALASTVIGSGHSLTALYEIVAKSPATSPASWLTFKVDYQEPAGIRRHALEFPLDPAPGRFADASSDFKFAAAVAGFGMVLRDSPYKGTTTLANVAAWAEAGRGDDPGGYRSEFLDLVRAASHLER